MAIHRMRAPRPLRAILTSSVLNIWQTGAGSTSEIIAGLAGKSGNVDFGEVETKKLALLHEAAGNFLDRGANDSRLAGQWEEFEQFCHVEAEWLTDYVLYAELRRQYNTGAWTEWPEPIRRRQPEALAEVTAKYGRALAQEQALQFAFSLQWNQLRESAARQGIRILGDVAIFVNLGFGRCVDAPRDF